MSSLAAYLSEHFDPASCLVLVITFWLLTFAAGLVLERSWIIVGNMLFNATMVFIAVLVVTFGNPNVEDNNTWVFVGVFGTILVGLSCSIYGYAERTTEEDAEEP